MEISFLGTPEDGPTLDLDHERFAYAGKFVMSNTGKVIVRDGGEILGALAYNPDRTDPAVAWIRYVTVREDRRGEGIGARLLDAVADQLLAESSEGRDGQREAVRIAVNNPFAYEAAYKAGFRNTGRETGLAELVLERPRSLADEQYRAGLDWFRRQSDLSQTEATFVAARAASGPPPRL